MKPGDVVALKTGSPNMTVSTIEGDIIYCVWFETTTQGYWGDVKEAGFKKDLLIEVSRPSE